jgi:hypothetical protein
MSAIGPFTGKSRGNVTMVSRDNMEKARACGRIRGNPGYHDKIRVSARNNGKVFRGRFSFLLDIL